MRNYKEKIQVRHLSVQLSQPQRQINKSKLPDRPNLYRNNKYKMMNRYAAEGS